MTLAQLQRYIVGVLTGWVPNKSVLDKFSETADGRLLFNGVEVGSGNGTCSCFVTDEEVAQKIKDTLAALGIAEIATLEELQVAIANANGGTVKLVADLQNTDAIAINADMTLDLNGHKLTRTHESSNAPVLNISGGTVTITDSKASSNAEILSENAGYAMYITGEGTNVILNNVAATGDVFGICVKDGATITLNEGAVVSAVDKSDGFECGDAIRAYSGHVVVNKGAKVYGNADKDYSAGVELYSTATLTVNGGEVSGNRGVLVFGGTTIMGTQGTISGTVAAVSFYEDTNTDFNGTRTVTVAGGVVNGGFLFDNTEAATITISGGTFDTDPTAYIAEGHIATEENGVWTVE